MINDNDNIITQEPVNTAANEPVMNMFKTLYIGHSGRSHHSRMVQHMDSGQNTAVLKHNADKHGDLPPLFRSKIIWVHRKNLSRLACEALHMERSSNKCLMNRRGEWGKMTLHRLDVRELHPDMI